jgi:hypothetical protein
MATTSGGGPPQYVLVERSSDAEASQKPAAASPNTKVAMSSYGFSMDFS